MIRRREAPLVDLNDCFFGKPAPRELSHVDDHDTVVGRVLVGDDEFKFECTSWTGRRTNELSMLMLSTELLGSRKARATTSALFNSVNYGFVNSVKVEVVVDGEPCVVSGVSMNPRSTNVSYHTPAEREQAETTLKLVNHLTLRWVTSAVVQRLGL